MIESNHKIFKEIINGQIVVQKSRNKSNNRVEGNHKISIKWIISQTLT